MSTEKNYLLGEAGEGLYQTDPEFAELFSGLLLRKCRIRMTWMPVPV